MVRKKTITAKNLKESLLKQLKNMGADTPQFEDLVNDYVSFYEIKNKLILDISARGVSIEWRNGEKSHGYKKNDSIAELVKVNAQMLKILQQLHIETIEGEVEDDDDF
jgi:DNA-directed RNA polymerase specialized sigma54-like protein